MLDRILRRAAVPPGQRLSNRYVLVLHEGRPWTLPSIMQ